MTDLIPPHDIAAEEAVLCAVLADAASSARVSDWLRPEDFYRADHGVIYRSVLAMVDSGAPVDLFTLIPYMRDSGVSESQVPDHFVSDLFTVAASSANIVAYAEVVLERSKLRKLMDMGSALVNAAASGRTPSADVAAGASQSLSELSRDSKAGLAGVKGPLKELFKEITRRWETGDSMIGIPTPWRDFNKLTGGLRPGVFYVIAGRPSMGKSIVSVQVGAFSALRGVRTAMFSVEMTAVECLQRACSAAYGIPYEWIDRPLNEGSSADEHWSNIGAAIGALQAAPLLIDETPALRVEQLMARARREHRHSPLGLIVLDHMHDMYRDPKKEARHVYGDIAQAGKTLAKELNVPVVFFAQLNRNVAGRADKRPVMTDLRESGEIEQKADVIAFLHREDYYDKDTHLQGVVELIPAKGRNLRLGETIYLRNDFEHMRLRDWEGPKPSLKAPSSGRKSGRDHAAGFDA